MVLQKVRALDHPVLVSLDALVLKDNIYRQLDRTLVLSFVRDRIKDCYDAATVAAPLQGDAA